MAYPFPVPGGSCLLNWTLTGDHGYIREFHLPEARAAITSQLQQMFANGQRRLCWVICYFAGGNSLCLDSSGGTLKPQDAQNLADLLALAKSIGFEEHLVEMDPQWTAAWTGWTAPETMGSLGTRDWQPKIYAENLQFTFAIAEAFDRAGVAYGMDLLAELDPQSPIGVEYGQRLWRDWCAQRGGPDKSVGFSIIGVPQFIAKVPSLYANGLVPQVFSVHIYADAQHTTAQLWRDYKAQMASLGFWQGHIIGESYCDDPESDAAFQADSDGLFYRFVWPVHRADPSGTTQSTLTVKQRFN